MRTFNVMTRLALTLAAFLATAPLAAQTAAERPLDQARDRPFGTLREQAAMQQEWLKKRLDTFLPALMRKHGIDMWVVPMREYNEDPVFSSITAPETFAARRRTIYVFFDKCAAAGTADRRPRVRRAHRARRHVAGRRLRGARDRRRRPPATSAAGRRPSCGATSSGRCSRSVIEERKPQVIGINRSTVFAFSDGLSSGELQGMSRRARRARGRRASSDAEALPLELIAVAAARGRSVLRADAGAGLVDDADDVLERR